MGVWKTQLYPTVELVHNNVHCYVLTTSAQKMSFSCSLHWRTPSASRATDQQKQHHIKITTMIGLLIKTLLTLTQFRNYISGVYYKYCTNGVDVEKA